MMKLFISSLHFPILKVENKFAYQSTIKDGNGASGTNHNGFPSLIEVEDRLWSVYRKGLHHVTYPASIAAKYSDDDGETWSNEIIAYNGDDTYTNFPDIFIEYPTAGVDVRDPNITDIGNNLIMLQGFTSIRVKEPTDPDWFYTRVANIIYYRVYNRVGKDIDFTTLVSEFYIESQDPDPHLLRFGQVAIKDGIIYSPHYTAGSNPGIVEIFKSTDQGATFAKIGQPTPIETQGGNETATFMLGNKMVMCARNSDEDPTSSRPAYLLESDDLGINWHTITQTPTAIHGMCGIVIDDDIVAIGGRDSSSRSNVSSIIEVYRWSTRTRLSRFTYFDALPTVNDQGYSSIIKYRDRYMIVYYQAVSESNTNCAIYFRQLIYNPATYTFSFPND